MWFTGLLEEGITLTNENITQQYRRNHFGSVWRATTKSACWHDEHVHEQITLSAFLSSDGAQFLFTNIFGSQFGPFDSKPVLTTGPSPIIPDQQSRPPAGEKGWLTFGSYDEDMGDDAVWG